MAFAKILPQTKSIIELMGPVFIGVDGGATKTKVAAIDKDKNVTGFAEADPANFNVVGIKTALKNCKIGILQALKNLKSAKIFGCFALAGVNFEKDKKVWQKEIGQDKTLSKLFSKPPQILNDTAAALKAGTDSKNAIVIISGTGSNCYGKNQAGLEAKVGGLDYLLADEGSGFAIGSQILKSVTCSLDGRGKPTILTALLFKKFNINSLEELYYLVYNKAWGKAEISEIANFSEIAARKNDRVALKIINSTADDLLLMAKTVIENLRLSNKKFSVVISGGVLKLDSLIFHLLKAKIKKFAPKAKFCQPKMEPALAAALIAAENFG